MTAGGGVRWEQRALAWLLRIGGGAQCLALFAIVLPTSWMAQLHGALGLGAFPGAPLTEYLARSVAGLYVLHGATMLLAAVDVRRFAPLVWLIIVSDGLFGLVMLWIDLYAGMPAFWTLSEGPPIVVLSVLMGWLAVRAGVATGAADPSRGCSRVVSGERDG